MEEKLRAALSEVASDIAGAEVEVELGYPEESHGDYATNVALKLSAASGSQPRMVAEQIATSVKNKLKPELEAATVAGPGFINFKLSDQALIGEILTRPKQPLAGHIAVAEYSDPNPFKVLHAGHLYTSIVGESIALLLGRAGAQVHRVNYGGDVGLHVAKSLWAMLERLGGENPDSLNQIAEAKRSEWMSEAYVSGNRAYETDKTAKPAIDELNRRVYELVGREDHDSALAQIYWTTRSWSYDEFDSFYARLNIIFDRFYPESETAPIGLAKVKEQLERGVFETSKGAVVFRGERYGMHTRVFVSSAGIPTYEAKEIGLAELKKRDFNYDRSVIITASEQQQYLAVVLKALEQFEPEQAKNTIHLTHGMVRLAGGKKMSSRLGNILRAEDVLSEAAAAAAKLGGKPDDRVTLAAVKYSFLKQHLGGDVVYEPEESVSVLGNSGPYLQYAHARARSILSKAGSSGQLSGGFDTGERSLALKLARFAAVVETATGELAPHLLCTYLYDLSQVFNRFYEANRVIGDPRQDLRLGLTSQYAARLSEGLGLLGIDAPEHL